jgi:hypothetical protein
MAVGNSAMVVLVVSGVIVSFRDGEEQPVAKKPKSKSTHSNRLIICFMISSIRLKSGIRLLAEKNLSRKIILFSVAR